MSCSNFLNPLICLEEDKIRQREIFVKILMWIDNCFCLAQFDLYIDSHLNSANEIVNWVCLGFISLFQVYRCTSFFLSEKTLNSATVLNFQYIFLKKTSIARQFFVVFLQVYRGLLICETNFYCVFLQAHICLTGVYFLKKK